jgi:hypothetical protein
MDSKPIKKITTLDFAFLKYQPDIFDKGGTGFVAFEKGFGSFDGFSGGSEDSLLKGLED